MRLWCHPGFLALAEGERILVFYLLAGPLTNRLGLFKLSLATAAEDLLTTPETLKKRLADVCVTFGWLFDDRARVFYIPSWFKWNPPENVNVMKGSLKDLNEIPPCALVDAFARNIETLPETPHQTFLEGLRQRLPKGIRTQKQYQEAVAETESEGTGAARPRAKNKNGFDDKNNDDARSATLLAVGTETLKMTNPNGPFNELIDALKNVGLQKGIPAISTSEATVALNAALAERRRHVQ
jgi:hypothetical protein